MRSSQEAPKSPSPPAVVALTPNGLALGRRVVEALGHGTVIDARGRVRGELRERFREGRPLICIMALGIVVRILGPLARSKKADPPVVVVDEGGRFVVSLLGGHIGANELAGQVGGAIGAVPVVTTASDSLGLPALDLLGRMRGWKIESDRDLTRAAAAVIRGEPVGVYVDAPEFALGELAPSARFPRLSSWPPGGGWPAVLAISDRLLEPFDACPTVMYRPPSLVAGVGCRRGVPCAEIEALFEKVLREHGLSPLSLGAVATASIKGDEPGLLDFASRHNVPLLTFALSELGEVAPLPTPSAAVRAKIGIGGVAEPAALLGSGAKELLVAKQQGGRVTLAIARRPSLFPLSHRQDACATLRLAQSAGRPPCVYFIGAGPGDPALLTVRARRLIERCPVCLYAGSLVPREVVACAAPDALVVDTSRLHLDEIIARIARAHAEGKDVARVHSGDPSLYGAIAEQMRRLDALRIPYEVVPGVSSFTAAAAALKMELTPAGLNQTIILTRAPGRTGLPDNESLAEFARHRTGLVLFLSAAQAPAVVEALSPHYGPNAPVVVAAHVSQPNQQLIRCTLSTLAAELRRARIRMTALIFVGPMLEPDLARDSRLYDPAYTHRFRKCVDRGP